MRQYRIAILGIGGVAEKIARAVAELPNATLVGGSCRTREKGEKFAAANACRWYASHDELLAHEKPDVGVICTPSGAHLDAAIACAAHKVHVLCEKPLEVTTARVKRMIDTCRDAGVVLGGIFPMRFNPAMVAVHAAAREGRFGQLATVGVTLPWWRDDAYYGAGRWQGTAALDGGGALMNQASHSIDLMQWLAAATMPNLAPDQNPVEEVYAYTAKRGHDPKRLEVEDAGVVALRFRGGALGQILASTAMWPGSLRRLVIGGRDGTAEVIEDELTTFRFRQERPDDATMREKFATKTKHQGGAGEALAFSHLNHQRNIADFLAALDENRDPLVTGLEATKAVAIIEACYESARTGRAVSI